MTTITISKTMPPSMSDSNDRSSTFSLGRKVYFNNSYLSYKNNPSLKSDFNTCKNKVTSNVCSKPIPNNSSSLRTQMLKLNTIGGASTKLKNNNDQIRYKSNESSNINLINHVRSRARNSGYIAPKK